MDTLTVRASTRVGRRSAALVAAVAACAAGPLLLVSPGVAPGAAAATSVAATGDLGRELVLDLDTAVAGGEGTRVPTAGTSPTTAEVRTNADAVVRVVRHEGAGRALRLPSFAAGADATTVPVALVAVTSTGSPDLDPGASDFVLGASVRLDATSTGTRVDNGDNVVQRGTFDAASQMKLQVDGRTPSCRVKGAEGAVTVFADTRLRADRWFDLTCRRTGATVTLVRERVLADGTVARRSWSRNGPIGSLSGLAPGVPLTVGGKTDPTGAPLSASADPMNGSIDDVYLDVLD
ncbi:hypothetical protein [Nocardioides sp. AX2bis]|uniref:hypothetical protein n=1 Tax=Nocardioides sp. AX2bis TaxID=2653157 RepID=UPI00135BBA2D|nr:hypothetical protein [Nocardioides sp. AX2bis]